MKAPSGGREREIQQPGEVGRDDVVADVEGDLDRVARDPRGGDAATRPRPPCAGHRPRAMRQASTGTNESVTSPTHGSLISRRSVSVARIMKATMSMVSGAGSSQGGGHRDAGRRGADEALRRARRPCASARPSRRGRSSGARRSLPFDQDRPPELRPLVLRPPELRPRGTWSTRTFVHRNFVHGTSSTRLGPPELRPPDLVHGTWSSVNFVQPYFVHATWSQSA